MRGNDPLDFLKANQAQISSQRPDFDEFEATELYCPKCGRAVPVRKHLLLVLPEGDKYEYRCQFCGEPVGDKLDKSSHYFGVLK